MKKILLVSGLSFLLLGCGFTSEQDKIENLEKRIKILELEMSQFFGDGGHLAIQRRSIKTLSGGLMRLRVEISRQSDININRAK